MIPDVVTDNPMPAVIVTGGFGFWLLIGAGSAAVRTSFRGRPCPGSAARARAAVDIVGKPLRNEGPR